MEIDILNKVKPVSDDRYLKLIDEAAKLGVKEVYICGGGEPLVRKDLLLRLMKLIKQKKMHGFLITNGTLFTEEDIIKIIEIGWDNISFSVDGANSRVNDSLRGKRGAFKLAVQNMKRFKELWRD